VDENIDYYVRGLAVIGIVMLYRCGDGTSSCPHLSHNDSHTIARFVSTRAVEE